MNLKITKLTEKSQYVKIIVYGRTGVGKTRFAATAPDVLFIDAEAGTLSIADKPIDVVTIQDFNQLDEIFDFLLKGDHKYKSVVIDSLTEVQLKCMDNIIKSEVERKPDRDPDVPTQQNWGKSFNQIRKLIRKFRDLPMNVIIVCEAKDDRDEETGIIYTVPALPGQLANKIPGYIDIVGYMDLRKDSEGNLIEKMLFRAIDRKDGKDRSGKLPVAMENPTFKKILNFVFKKEKK